MMADVDIAYNALYYNYIMVWRQETVANSGIFDLYCGGFRPQEVDIVDWYQGSASVHFEMGHLPFQDTYGLVLISLDANNDSSGNSMVYDDRKLGLLFDSATDFGLQNFAFFFAPNDPINEGAVTASLPFTIPLFVPVGFELAYVAISWGPFGDIHTITDWFKTPLSAPPTP